MSLQSKVTRKIYDNLSWKTRWQLAKANSGILAKAAWNSFIHSPKQIMIASASVAGLAAGIFGVYKLKK